MIRGGWLAFINILAGALILTTPAIVNRSPFFFYDSATYLALGRSILTQLHVPVPVPPGAKEAGAAARAAETSKRPPEASQQTPPHPTLSYLGGRSPYYSVPLTFVADFVGWWGIALLQSLVCAWLCWIAWETVGLAGRDRLRRYYLVLVVLAAGSTLPYFASYLMPDIFAGIAVVVAFLLIVGGGFTARRKVALTATLAFATAAHATNILLVLLVVLFGAGALLRSRGPVAITRRLIWPATACILALLSGPLFSTACYYVAGDVPRSPPYLAARILADGPGREYLRTECDRPRYALCAFRDRPLDDQNEILWSPDPKVGVFMVADYQTRIRISREELPFLFSVLLAEPMREGGVAWRHFVEQATLLTIGHEIGVARPSWTMMVQWEAPWERSRVVRSLSYRGMMPFGVIDVVIVAAFVVALLAILVRFRPRWMLRALRARASPSFLLAEQVTIAGLLTLLLVNAAVCGILSGPTNRYQGRISWLVPALALALWSLQGRQRRGDQATPDRA